MRRTCIYKLFYALFLCFMHIALVQAQVTGGNSRVDNKQSLNINRKLIDSLDDELIQVLGQRERIVKAIGQYKAKNHMAPLQAGRFQQVIDKSIAAGNKQGLSPEFVTAVMNAVHQESLRIEGDSTAALQPFSAADSLNVKTNVSRMAAAIAAGITAKGPVAWLDYFEDTPDFFMANSGELAFNDYRSAKIFIQGTLVKTVTRITLRWSNIRVDPLTPYAASIGSGFHEELTFVNGKTIPIDGFFTGTALLTANGWKLHNCHWSAKK